jgi:prefoldin subunit 5
MSKVIGLTLKIDGVEQSIKSIDELETTIEKLNEELKSTDIGSERFKQLSGELQNARSELKTFEKTFEGLEPQQKAESFELLRRRYIKQSKQQQH